MSLDEFRKRLQARQETPEPPLVAARTFLQAFFFDADSMAEVGHTLASLARVNTRGIEEGLAGLEALLADPPRDGTLARLVAYDANLSLDEPGDEAALRWLRSVADMVRQVLTTHTGGGAPPSEGHPREPG